MFSHCKEIFKSRIAGNKLRKLTSSFKPNFKKISKNGRTELSSVKIDEQTSSEFTVSKIPKCPAESRSKIPRCPTVSGTTVEETDFHAVLSTKASKIPRKPGFKLPPSSRHHSARFEDRTVFNAELKPKTVDERIRMLHKRMDHFSMFFRHHSHIIDRQIKEVEEHLSLCQDLFAEIFGPLLTARRKNMETMAWLICCIFLSKKESDLRMRAVSSLSLRIAFFSGLAYSRTKQLASVDKANSLSLSYKGTGVQDGIDSGFRKSQSAFSSGKDDSSTVNGGCNKMTMTRRVQLRGKTLGLRGGGLNEGNDVLEECDEMNEDGETVLRAIKAQRSDSQLSYLEATEGEIALIEFESNWDFGLEHSCGIWDKISIDWGMDRTSSDSSATDAYRSDRSDKDLLLKSHNPFYSCDTPSGSVALSDCSGAVYPLDGDSLGVDFDFMESPDVKTRWISLSDVVLS